MARLRDTRLRRASGGATAAAAVAMATAPPGVNHSQPSVSPPTSSSAWDEALKQLPASGTLKAGLLHVYLGDRWPSWTAHLLSSAAVSNGIAFYFLGPPLSTRGCANCAWLPMDVAALDSRIVSHLGLPAGAVILAPRGATGSRATGAAALPARKLCDLKPMWPALFPELSSRHEWIGHADTDILWGNLSAEVAALSAEDELLVPSTYYPQPLTNGNLMLLRSTPKMIHAFRRSAHWRRALLQPTLYVFDEHWGSSGPGMHHVFRDMMLADELHARPTRRLLVQDMIFRGKRRNGLYPTLDSYGAHVAVGWRGGALLAARDGPCVCSKQVWDVTLSSCAECLTQPGALLPEVRMRVRAEVLGLHFQVWKVLWARSGALPHTAAAPACPGAFGVHPQTGFSCGMPSALLAGPGGS